MSETFTWIGFNLLIFILLIFDLNVFNRKKHEIQTREAILLSLFWIALSLLFNLFVYFTKGPVAGLQFFTGYLIEKSLSVDNIFVFVVLFKYFQVAKMYQHKVLYWGILGALVMRITLILTGITLIERFHWFIYVLGGFLIISGIKLLFQKEKEQQPEKNFVVKLFKKFFPVTDAYHEEKFFVRIDGRLFATPLFIVLLVIETTDVVFALDSIPAIFAITTDPFIIYSSNVFAILGLRSLYFVLEKFVDQFRYLGTGLALILIFIGCKMLIAGYYPIPILFSLGMIVAILTISVLASLYATAKEKKPH